MILYMYQLITYDCKMVKLQKNKTSSKRYPTLSTVLMVEDFLKSHQDVPLKVSQIRENLPKKVMHQTLKTILNYLWQSGKIIYGPKGIQWIYSPPKVMEKLMEDCIEL